MMKRCTQVLVCAFALLAAAPAAWASSEDGGWDDGDSGWGGGGDGGWGDGGDWDNPAWDGETSILDDYEYEPLVDYAFVEEPADYDLDCRDAGFSCSPFMEPVEWNPASRLRNLNDIDRGTVSAEASTRLGAYEATRGYQQGTVGYAIHNAIGDIYLLLGDVGQEKIGLVFNNPITQTLYDLPVSSWANLAVATIEYNYWLGVRQADWTSFGGYAGAAFTPEVRAWLQENVYSGPIPLLRAVPQAPRP